MGNGRIKQTPIEEIDTLLNTFMIDPYNKIYEDDFNPYLSMNSNENIVYSNTIQYTATQYKTIQYN